MLENQQHKAGCVNPSERNMLQNNFRSDGTISLDIALPSAVPGIKIRALPCLCQSPAGIGAFWNASGQPLILMRSNQSPGPA
jgi:hypothetical protein